MNSNVGTCDACGKTGIGLHISPEGIGVCHDCILPMITPSIVLIVSNSRASQDELVKFIHTHCARIKMVVLTTQLKGPLIARLIKAAKRFWRGDKRFFLYKVLDSWCGSKLRKACKSYNIFLLKTNDVNSQVVVQEIRFKNVDVIISVYANQIFKAPLLASSKHGAINLHGSLLPHYRGPAQYYWYKKNKDTTGGVSIHFMNEGCDTGNILSQCEFVILPQDTMGALHKIITTNGMLLLNRIVTHNNFNSTKQEQTNERPLPMP